MLVYRITHKDFSTKLYASGAQGRWNGEGKKVIYSAESIPLAFLENMIRRQGVGFNHDFKIMIIDIPDSLKLTAINAENLAAGWRDFKNYSKCQPLGDKWYDEGKTLALKVPSAVLPLAFNYVINTTHAGFNKIQLIQTTDLVPDQRIEEILKQYSGK
jgi:RES domain-containing protein